MKQIHLFSIILILVLLISSTVLLVFYTQSSNQTIVKEPVYFGIAFCGETVEQAKILIDKTKTYTNLFILNAGQNRLCTNQTAVMEILDYATDADLDIIVNLGSHNRETWQQRLKILNEAKDAYGTKFLGVYYDDEPGGMMIDWNWEEELKTNIHAFGTFTAQIREKLQSIKESNDFPDNYSLEAQWFSWILQANPGHTNLKASNITTFTSDYTLYWFNYLGGYSVMLAQLGWNNSVNQHLSMVRGAANLQDKDWGTIITWKYREPPYIDSADNIYDQLVASYDAGAKYITIFNWPYYDPDNPYGILTQEHFEAMERFWNQVVTKRAPTSAQAQVALVLPKDYGAALRDNDEKIWGIWQPDDKTALIHENLDKLLAEYGLGLDIVYDDPAYSKECYNKLYYWNQTLP
ncbi:MAG: hypothetical protein FWE73_09240 [Candidatus Bathyarchaeota archaeon]|nr:hypothetical protein [Candidatus Termitimicrobium sp.]